MNVFELIICVLAWAGLKFLNMAGGAAYQDKEYSVSNFFFAFSFLVEIIFMIFLWRMAS